MKITPVLLLIFVACAKISMACAPVAFGEPPCASWTRADAVFSGKVLKIENLAKTEGFPEGSQKILFQVLENFKGVDNPTFAVVSKLVVGADGADKVKKGETWIVYASNDIVGKSFAEFRRVKIEPKETSAELEILKNIRAGKTPTAVTGRIVSGQGVAYEYEAAAITVEGGGKRFTAQTDADGTYNIPVPDGNYKVELKFPYKARVKWDDNLLGASLAEGTPTVFRYEVRLNDGDCQFSFIEVSKTN